METARNPQKPKMPNRTVYFLSDGTGITAEQAGALLSAGDSAPIGPALDPSLTQKVISEATSSVLEAADAMNLIMALIALSAAAAVVVLFRRPSPH
jgi:regulator of PEP synthase PpsR (kinase-PPPase family)